MKKAYKIKNKCECVINKTFNDKSKDTRTQCSHTCLFLVLSKEAKLTHLSSKTFYTMRSKRKSLKTY